MLSKNFRLRKLNKIIATSILMGGCLIFGAGQEYSATGFKGVNSGATGAGTNATSSGSGGLLGRFTGTIRRFFTGGTNGSRSIASSSGAIGGSGSEVSVSNEKTRTDLLINTIVAELPSKSGDSNKYVLHRALLERTADLIESLDEGTLVYTYVNSTNGNKIKMTVGSDGKIIKSIAETNDIIHHNNFGEGWFQKTTKIKQTKF